MGLALPLALLALLGVGIPLWLHRVRRRLLRDQPLPTLSLLSRAASRRKRILSFRDRPLLLSRVALIALLAFALSRPFLSQIVSYAGEHPIALAIVIDDSMSMGRKSKRIGTLFQAAVSRAQSVLGELAPDSEACLLLAGAPPRRLLARTSDVPSARSLLSTLDHSGARGTALAQAVALATRELAGTKLAAREVLVLSDCAAHAGADAITASLSVRVECMPTREHEPNAFFREVSLARSGDGPDPAELRAVLGVTGTLREVAVGVYVDGRAESETNVSLREGDGELVVPLAEPSLQRARTLSVRIETHDALLADNVRELSLGRAMGSSVLLVDGDPALNQRDDELRFAALALSLGDAAHPAPRTVRIDADGLDAEDLNLYDVIVLANMAAPSAAVAERLRARVAEGAGLLISGGDQIDTFAYRGVLTKLLPTLIRSRAYADPSRAVDLGLPMQSDLVPDRGMGLETGRTTERLLVEAPTPPSVSALSFDDGSPLLVTGQYERGRIALWTTTLDDDWTSLPLTPGFVPLLHGVVRGLATVDALPPGPHAAGTVLSARAPLGAHRVYVVTPDGRSVDVPISAGTLRIQDTATVGAYHTFATFDERGERELNQLSFTVMPDPRDSDLSPGKKEQRFVQHGATGVSKPKGLDPWLWLLFGLAAIAEGVLRLLTTRASRASHA